MTPVSVLPAAGLIVAMGRLLQGSSDWPTWVGHIGQVLYSGGLAIFEQLPVVFAVGVAIGFAQGAGVAALSAVVGYFTLVALLKAFSEIQQLELPMNTGVFGGILMGFVAAYFYRRFSKTELPRVLGFFSGKRLVTILVAFSAIFIATGLSLVWPPLQSGINHFGEWVMSSSWGGAFYAAGKRLLIPVGLHHVFYQPFLFQFGEFMSTNGSLVNGDSARYFAGDPSAGIFMAAEFPIMLFGLPAAALAMVLRAPKEKRKAVGGVMLTAALTSIITGITEPIEFAFIFVAPLLYVLHVGLAFCSGYLTTLFDVHLGYTFSASLIDFGLGYFNQKNSLFLWTLIGPLIALLYFSSFYTLIGALNLKTPGRENANDNPLAELDPTAPAIRVTPDSLAGSVLAALGGSSNIKDIDACITRLRVTVHNGKIVEQARMKSLGAAGLFHDGQGNFQIIFGTQSDTLKERILRLMSLDTPTIDPADAGPLTVLAPLRGLVLPLESVPDQTFSQRIMGDGIAIEPTEGLVTAPFDGVVVQVFKTGHAIGLENQNGVELLIHIGIDTVKMKGAGFEVLVKNGDQVKKGQQLIKFDLDLVRKNAPSIITPIVVTNSSNFKAVKATTAKTVNPIETLLHITK